MTDDPEIASFPAVFFDPGGAGERPRLVHHYQGGAYQLLDIVRLLQYGREVDVAPLGETGLILEAQELGKLKMTTDAYSFDYDEGLIALCYDILRFLRIEAPDAQPPYRFTANF